jgi:hypothetical protein
MPERPGAAFPEQTMPERPGGAFPEQAMPERVAPPLGLAPAVGGPTPSPLPFTGQNPNPVLQTAPPWGPSPTAPLGALGATFGAGMAGSPTGVPVAAGGGGLFDPNREMQAMMAASTSAGSYGGEGGADPEWEEAVRRAMGLFGS